MSYDPDAYAEKILRDNLQKVHDASRLRKAANAYKADSNWKTRRCPGCGDGLHRRIIGNGGGSILVCPKCSWTLQIKEELQDGRYPGEGYAPGRTSKPNPTVIFDAHGQIKSIRDI